MCGHAYSGDYEQKIMERSNEAVKGCETFDEKVLALRRYVDSKMKFPKPFINKNGQELKPGDIYPLITLERLDSGLGGWCDQQAHVFIRLAQKQGITTRMVYLRARPPMKDEHTIAEALAPDGRWVVVSLDSIHGFEPFTKDSRIATREDMANDPAILRDNPRVKEFAAKEPTSWGNEDYLSMFTNPPLHIFSDEETINMFLGDKGR
jgi:hypothetical protein